MSDAGSKLRLFFAVRPDPAVRDAIGEAAQSLSLGTEARLVPRNNYHLTLVFIGEAAVSQLAVLQRIGADQAAPALALKFDAFEYWPKPEVVVAVARTIPAGLQTLWQRLHRELATQQWGLDPKRLRPHVTLARKVTQAPVLQAMSSFEWPVRDFSLMRSDTSGHHSVYTVLDTWSLLDEA